MSAAIDLHYDEMQRIKTAIANTVAKREELKTEMETWYDRGKTHYPRKAELLVLDIQLSELDSRYKLLWDTRR